MISMDFLKHSVSGMEFIDFQSSDFYTKLSSYLESQIDAEGFLSPESAKGIKPLIAEYTGFKNIDIKFEQSGNLSVDTGYFSPNHVLNNDMVDELLKTTETTLYRWFTQNTDKLFRGGIDYKTGKVTGSFQTVPVTLRINVNLNQTFPKDKVGKFGIPLQGILCGAIAHELGHVFSGCMMMSTVVSDNLTAKAALRFYRTSNTEEDRVVVLKDIGALLDVPAAKQAELQRLAQDPDDKAVFMYFDKMVSQRNMRRSLSVGVERMSSEVVADMYAIRMGCDKGIIAAISILTDHGCIQTVVNSLLTATMFTLLLFPSALMMSLGAGGIAVALMFSFFTFTFVFVMDYFSKGYSGVYNADHRRFDDAARQLIQKLKEDKSAPASQKAQMVKEIDQLMVHAKTLRPWYESTVIHRFMGWVFSQSDFKLQEIEHYTGVVANHEVNTFSHKLQALKARRDPDNRGEPETDKTYEF
jgi:hypothetical protein